MEIAIDDISVKDKDVSVVWTFHQYHSLSGGILSIIGFLGIGIQYIIHYLKNFASSGLASSEFSRIEIVSFLI